MNGDPIEGLGEFMPAAYFVAVQRLRGPANPRPLRFRLCEYTTQGTGFQVVPGQVTTATAQGATLVPHTNTPGECL